MRQIHSVKIDDSLKNPQQISVESSKKIEKLTGPETSSPILATANANIFE